jgi:RNA polymerase sigma-70 factor, ECF subfamily
MGLDTSDPVAYRALILRDEAAFSELYSMNCKWTYKLIVNFLPAKEHKDAPDVHQDTWIKVWNAGPSFRADSSVRTWISRIAINKAYEHTRRERNKSSRTLPLDMINEDNLCCSSRQSPSALYDQKELGSIVSGVMGKIPDHYQKLLYYAYFEGEAPGHTAENAGAKTSTPRVKNLRARKAFRSAWLPGALTYNYPVRSIGEEKPACPAVGASAKARALR